MLASDKIKPVGKHAFKPLGIGIFLRPADKFVKSKVRNGGISEGGNAYALKPRKFTPRNDGRTPLVHPYRLLGFKQHIHAAGIAHVTDRGCLRLRDRSVDQIFPVQEDMSADGADVPVKAESADLRFYVAERAPRIDYEDMPGALRFFQRGTGAFRDYVI